jgi:hypothetical protein
MDNPTDQEREWPGESDPPSADGWGQDDLEEDQGQEHLSQQLLLNLLALQLAPRPVPALPQSVLAPRRRPWRVLLFEDMVVVLLLWELFSTLQIRCLGLRPTPPRVVPTEPTSLGPREAHRTLARRQDAAVRESENHPSEKAVEARQDQVSSRREQPLASKKTPLLAGFLPKDIGLLPMGGSLMPQPLPCALPPHMVWPLDASL